MKDRPVTPTTATPEKPKAATPPLTAEEAEVIAMCERMEGRKLTQQEINLSLEQARFMGVI